jgi:hypothetical protein
VAYANGASGSNGNVSSIEPPVPDPYAQEQQYQPPVPTHTSTTCEEADVIGVYDEGKVLALDDGRHLRVADADTVTSSVWVAPFDGLICDDGGRFINKDDNEGVDLAD